ncbi:FadR/GntR family transcriptional regulator [Streptomyces sp. NPDC055092]
MLDHLPYGVDVGEVDHRVDALCVQVHGQGDQVDVAGALAGRRVAAAEGGAAFVDADIALHATVVAAAHNPVLTDLFAEFAPALRQGLIDLLTLVDVRAAESDHGDAAHTALVDAVEAGDEDAAEHEAQEELAVMQGKLARDD